MPKITFIIATSATLDLSKATFDTEVPVKVLGISKPIATATLAVDGDTLKATADIDKVWFHFYPGAGIMSAKHTDDKGKVKIDPPVIHQIGLGPILGPDPAVKSIADQIDLK